MNKCGLYKFNLIKQINLNRTIWRDRINDMKMTYSVYYLYKMDISLTLLC